MGHIVITGAAGFIGSCMLRRLNLLGRDDLILVDDFSSPTKNLNFKGKAFLEKVHRDDLFEWFESAHRNISFVFHFGARTDTAEDDQRIFDQLNLSYTKSLWKACTNHRIPMVYASSAATYGAGKHGYDDTHENVALLEPMNAYAKSKQGVDEWILQQNTHPPFWAGLKFFNVYGPNEYHKGSMASAVLHFFKQIQTTGQLKLFRSHQPEIKDGEQKRDFIYVKDVVEVCCFMLNQQIRSGIYNLGTARASSFLELAHATFAALGKTPDIGFTDTPEKIRPNYQYYTKASMRKLISSGYKKSFYTLEEGVADYVRNYLLPGAYF